MGAHSSADDLMAGVESDSIRVKAAAYAVLLTGWLNTPVTDVSPLDDMYSGDVEVIRSVRDVLEAVGRG